MASVSNYASLLEKGKAILEPDDFSRLNRDIEEIDPANPNAGTLSASRRGLLMERINDCSQRIARALNPAMHIPEKEHMEAVKEIQIEIAASPTPKALHTQLKKLDPSLLEKIYKGVWIVKGCPSEENFSSELLRKDYSVLKQTFPPFFSLKEGTILEQILGALSSPPNDVDLFHLFQRCIQERFWSHKQIKAIYRHCLPPSTQAHIPKPPYFGRNLDTALHTALGAHFDRTTGMTAFCVFAPRATQVVLHLTKSQHVEYRLPMIRGEKGVFAVETEHALPGRTYHFMITGPRGGAPVKKVDPFALGNIIHSSLEGDENHESVVVDNDFVWTDSAWMRKRAQFDPAKQPMTIYEVHAPSWKKKENGDLLNWRELAQELAAYCKEMGYTHVELMAAFEHPQPISMGYQITNYFCVNSRLGTLDDFQWCVNFLHEKEIGVILDWVPAHFALDKFALSLFDGSPLFEDDDPRFASHPTWGTKVFDFKKPFARDFLASNAYFILKQLHADGLRVDAVWAMLDLAYDRAPGCRKNVKGGNIDLHAKEFLQNITMLIRKEGALAIAEETFGYENLTCSSDFKGPNGKRGIGFNLTWHIGWMSDSLRYFSTSIDKRPDLYPLLVKTLKDIDHNRPRGRVVMALSHDENCNGKNTIQGKMSGSPPERFANVRLLLALQTLRGGGPLLDFMGNEIAQSQEWHGRLIQSLRNPQERGKPGMQWEELDPQVNPYHHHYHRGVQSMRRALNQLYLNHPGLWNQTEEGFQEFKIDDSNNCIIGFRRFGNGKQLACLFNTSHRDLKDYFIDLPNRFTAPQYAKLQTVTEVFNSDRTEFGGLGRLNPTVHLIRDVSTWPTFIRFHFPPLTAIVLEEHLTNP